MFAHKKFKPKSNSPAYTFPGHKEQVWLSEDDKAKITEMDQKLCRLSATPDKPSMKYKFSVPEWEVRFQFPSEIIQNLFENVLQKDKSLKFTCINETYYIPCKQRENERWRSCREQQRGYQLQVKQTFHEFKSPFLHTRNQSSMDQPFALKFQFSTEQTDPSKFRLTLLTEMKWYMIRSKKKYSCIVKTDQDFFYRIDYSIVEESFPEMENEAAESTLETEKKLNDDAEFELQLDNKEKEEKNKEKEIPKKEKIKRYELELEMIYDPKYKTVSMFQCLNHFIYNYWFQTGWMVKNLGCFTLISSYQQSQIPKLPFAFKTLKPITITTNCYVNLDNGMYTVTPKTNGKPYWIYRVQNLLIFRNATRQDVYALPYLSEQKQKTYFPSNVVFEAEETLNSTFSIFHLYEQQQEKKTKNDSDETHAELLNKYHSSVSPNPHPTQIKIQWKPFYSNVMDALTKNYSSFFEFDQDNDGLIFQPSNDILPILKYKFPWHESIDVCFRKINNKYEPHASQGKEVIHLNFITKVHPCVVDSSNSSSLDVNETLIYELVPCNLAKTKGKEWQILRVRHDKKFPNQLTTIQSVIEDSVLNTTSFFTWMESWSDSTLPPKPSPPIVDRNSVAKYLSSFYPPYFLPFSSSSNSSNSFSSSSSPSSNSSNSFSSSSSFSSSPSSFCSSSSVSSSSSSSASSLISFTSISTLAKSLATMTSSGLFSSSI
jgi:hypothetical protein